MSSQQQTHSGSLILGATACGQWMITRECQRAVLLTLESIDPRLARKAEAAIDTDDLDPLELARRKGIEPTPANAERIAREWADSVA